MAFKKACRLIFEFRSVLRVVIPPFNTQSKSPKVPKELKWSVYLYYRQKFGKEFLFILEEKNYGLIFQF